ncbi:Inactive protein kinase SELMODRAFT_444075 [Linum grandiflorum]
MEGASPSKVAWQKVSFFCVAAFFSHVSGECVLNFNDEFPYQPTGECIPTNKQPEVKDLNTITTTLCCRNVLNVITKNLALRVSQNHGALFLPQYQWKDCSGPFPQQKSVSPLSCGFDVLYSGSGPCSSLSMSAMEQEAGFRTTVNSCSNFNASSSFDDACSSCVRDIVTLTRHLLSNSYVSSDDATQAMICTVSVVVAIAGEKLQQGDSVAKEIGSVMIAVVTLILVLVLVKFVRRNKDKGKRKAGKPLLETQEVAAWSGLYRFSKNEIQNAMNYSSEKTCLGRGSAGQVYRGVLPSGQVVAIKHIHQGHTSDSFTREVEGLSRIRHPNLVCLFGCCIHGSDRYLVYEFCSAGNLAQHLLTKMIGMEESKVFTEVRGTIGYMDPEYMSNAKLTCASDIYSFGIVILQLLSGRKVIELDLDARDQLTRKAKDVSLGKRPLEDFEDPRLNGELNKEDFEVILQIAVLKQGQKLVHLEPHIPIP